MKMKWSATLLATVWLTASAMAESPWPKIRVLNFSVTSQNSPSNSLCLQNVMSWLDGPGNLGYIPNDYVNDPVALYRPPILRAVEILNGASGFYLKDGTNNPTGNFVHETGRRLGWAVDWSDTNSFLASDIWFRLWSDDGNNNTLGFSGNVASNLVSGVLTNLTFISTLQGEIWNSDGTKTSLHAGESITNRVNRVIALIRVAYGVNNMTDVGNDFSYFRGKMNFSSWAAFYRSNGQGATNNLSSHLKWSYPKRFSEQGYGVDVAGQRELGLSYTLYSSPEVVPFTWSVVTNLQHEGWIFHTNDHQHYFYRASEENIAPASLIVEETGSPPKAVGSNGPE